MPISSAQPTPLSVVTTEPTITPTSTTATSPIVLEGFEMPVTDGFRIFFDNHLSDLTGWTIDNEKNELHVFRTDNRGGNWKSSTLPIQQSWESQVDQNQIFSVLNNEGSSWILLTSKPSENIVNKTLYRTDDKGENWSFIGDYTSKITGDVTGIVFTDGKNGWISSSYKGKDSVPFYHTVDGGHTWNIQKLQLATDYPYGNVYPPYFDTDGHGTVKVEYVKSVDKKSIFYETSDNGQTWHLFTTALITKLKGNKDALKATRQFAEAWLSKDEKKLNSLTLQKLPESDLINMKNRDYVFFGVLPLQEVGSVGELCLGLQYQTDENSERQIMAVCLRKQPSSNQWKVYMLD
ncbi:hypothetical protein GCM10008018_69790 [Paenibacillus marchantiophytorum]|uniref:Exo-alpha-sialidase n=1 Tax=Paenibacillus marchantiophytorum TaxID=1619310 RepID=A0ABQ1FJV5_9BACL|nr:hypothetical protein GCM10008018_69790 [Paenibacillus marchantiophytorum]